MLFLDDLDGLLALSTLLCVNLGQQTTEKVDLDFSVMLFSI
jgi:hypothetical protein